MASANLKLVHRAIDDLPDPMPETVRPFRLWDPTNSSYVGHRFYSTERRALDSALLLIRWEQVGRVIEVIDARTMAWRASYKRNVNSIAMDQRASDRAILAAGGMQ